MSKNQPSNAPIGPSDQHRRQQGRKEIQAAAKKKPVISKPFTKNDRVLSDRESILRELKALGMQAIHLSLDTENRKDAHVDQTTTALIGNAESFLTAHVSGNKADRAREDHLSLIGSQLMTLVNHMRERMRLRLVTVIDVRWTPARIPGETDDLTIRLGAGEGVAAA